MPEGAVYVGRPTEWGNPWTVGTVATIEWPIGRHDVFAREVEITPHIAVALYRWAGRRSGMTARPCQEHA